ncbi:MAG: hypothetical protein EBU57_10875 [Alphaproteobacteria bacterium]|nr:hypothetical protein [Alphaproteobacteria bacterium]
MLALADHPHGGEEIQHILSGQMLFISWSEVLAFLPLYIVAMAAWFGVPRVRTGLGFFMLFALVVTASVQLVGVYVVFASLILPALAVNTMSRGKTIAGMIAGVLGVAIGIAVATLRDLPAGPVMVFSFAVVAVLYRFGHRVYTNR